MATDASPLSFRVLLYRYLFFGWLFRDVNRGNLFERTAAWRHNLDRAPWLLTYLRRWAALGVVSFGLGLLFEHGLSSHMLSACFYVPSVLSVVVNTVIGVLIAGFKLLPVRSEPVAVHVGLVPQPRCMNTGCLRPDRGA